MLTFRFSVVAANDKEAILEIKAVTLHDALFTLNSFRLVLAGEFYEVDGQWTRLVVE